MATINQQSLDTGNALQDLYSRAAGLADGSADLLTQSGDASALVVKTAGLAALETQEKNLAAATALGTNPDAASFMLTDLANNVNARYAERDAAIVATQKAAGANIFIDGPLGWLDAQLSLPELQMEQKTTEARYDNARLHYQQLTQLTQASVATNNAIEQTKTLSSVEAEAQAVANAAQVKANDAKIQGLQLNARGIEEAQNMRQRVFDNNLRLRSEARADEQMKMAREGAARARANDAQNKKDATSYLSAVNIHRVSIGQSPLDEQMLRLKMSTNQGKLEMDDAFELGLVSMQTGKQMVGNNPFNSLITMNQAGIKVSTGTQELAKGMAATIEGAVRGADVKAKDMPNFVNATLAAEAKKMQGDSSTGKGNWYAPPPLMTIADGELKNLAFVQKVVRPQLEAGVTDFQPDALMAQGLALVRKGELKLEDVTGAVSALARKSVAYNNGYKNYEGVGLPKQTNLRMRMETTGPIRGAFNEAISTSRNQGNALGANILGMFAGGTSRSVIDITDDTQLAAYANRVLAGEISVNLQNRAATAKKTQQ